MCCTTAVHMHIAGRKQGIRTPPSPIGLCGTAELKAILSRKGVLQRRAPRDNGPKTQKEQATPWRGALKSSRTSVGSREMNLEETRHNAHLLRGKGLKEATKSREGEIDSLKAEKSRVRPPTGGRTKSAKLSKPFGGCFFHFGQWFLVFWGWQVLGCIGNDIRRRRNGGFMLGTVHCSLRGSSLHFVL